MEMRKLILLIMIVGGVLARNAPAMAQAELQPEWNDDTRLSLGQCMVAERRWDREDRTEHAAIAHVLLRRWRRYREMHPGSTYSFDQMIRQYCAVHRASDPSPHQRWVRNLPWGPMETDPGMDPEETDWHNYTDDWDRTRETVTLFEQGELRDPLPHAMQWGSTSDGNPHGGSPLPRVVMSVGGRRAVALLNWFYAEDREDTECYRAVMVGPVQVFVGDRCRH